MNRSKLLTRTVLFAGTVLAIALTQTSTGNLRRTQAKTPQSSRPFRMLVLGDSVMWGQGLAENNKFSHLVAQWICAERNGGVCPAPADVDLVVEAHSGAVVIVPQKNGEIDKNENEKNEECLREPMPLRCQGEVPYAYPTIVSQVDLAVRQYSKRAIPAETIDLILVDGGINDYGAPKILLPFLGGNVADKAEEHCHEPMKKLLTSAHAAFPNATIVVAGYFPLVSKDTHLIATIFKTIKDVFPKQEVNSKDKQAIMESDPEEMKKASAKPKKASSIFETLPERSLKWRDASNKWLNKAVQEFNDAQTASGGKAAAIFAGVTFADENAYAASHSFLWQLGAKDATPFECPDFQGAIGALLQNLVVNDQQQAIRPCMCIRAGRGDDGHGISCMRAGAFHPNVLGAQAYFEAIKKQLDSLRANGS